MFSTALFVCLSEFLSQNPLRHFYYLLDIGALFLILWSHDYHIKRIISHFIVSIRSQRDLVLLGLAHEMMTSVVNYVKHVNCVSEPSLVIATDLKLWKSTIKRFYLTILHFQLQFKFFHPTNQRLIAIKMLQNS